jgi:hypothetical protein
MCAAADTPNLGSIGTSLRRKAAARMWRRSPLSMRTRLSVEVMKSAYELDECGCVESKESGR